MVRGILRSVSGQEYKEVLMVWSKQRSADGQEYKVVLMVSSIERCSWLGVQRGVDGYMQEYREVLTMSSIQWC